MSKRKLMICIRLHNTNMINDLTQLLDISQSLELWSIYDFDTKRMNFYVAMDAIIKYLQYSQMLGEKQKKN